ncbi:MAG: MFS transporter [Hyphomonadaceae bacterium]|nr:MFS transporter [Hyphomonadaceae bacterium]
MADIHSIHADAKGDLTRGIVIGLVSFLTLVDLFAAQAILPSLAAMYDVTPGEIGAAINASTFGMAVSGLGVALVARKLDRRMGIWLSLALLAIPTLLLAHAPNLAALAALRVVQGVFMAAAFTLTLAYLAEECTPVQAAGALAAYVTGNVASNLFGRLIAATLVSETDVATTFTVFAGLNLLGAALAFFVIRPSMRRMTSGQAPKPPLAVWKAHFATPGLPAAFLLGFLILFVFLGVFTYVNFVLAGPPFSLKPAQLGLVYFVFAPALVTTPLAGAAGKAFGARRAIWGGLFAAAIGAALTLSASLPAVLAGLALIGAGTFFAQAAATGFVSGRAKEDRAAAGGLYLASYYLGGLVGGFSLGIVYMQAGWTGVVVTVGAALLIAALATFALSPQIKKETIHAVA